MCYPKLSSTNLNTPTLVCHIVKYTNQNASYIILNYLNTEGKSSKTKKTVYSIGIKHSVKWRVKLGTRMMGKIVCPECKWCGKHIYKVQQIHYNHSVAVSGKCIHSWAYISRYFYKWRPDNTLGHTIKIQRTQSFIYILGAVTKLKFAFFPPFLNIQQLWRTYYAVHSSLYA